ncbi:MAG TPA: helix-turn-helix transcriptional regulator [Bacteroidales bacterium]|nr:helix-turn-helix transcriptional regulator [Bacteroidales bacterium]
MKPKKVPESYKGVNQKLSLIGERVRQLRKAKSPNYEDFASENNINKVTLNRIERGDSVSTKLFLKVLEKLKINSLEDFFKGL